MNREQFDNIVNETIKSTGALLIAKGAEYAGDADRLANFKRNAEKQGTTPLQIWKQYIGKHIDSLDTYFKRIHDEAFHLVMNSIRQNGINPSEITRDEFQKHMESALPQAIRNINAQLSEPIEGRFHDVINYCFLGIALLTEAYDGSGKKA